MSLRQTNAWTTQHLASALGAARGL
jgi:hypothetical protein